MQKKEGREQIIISTEEVKYAKSQSVAHTPPRIQQCSPRGVIQGQSI